MTQFKLLLITSIFFVLYAIPIFVLPKFIGDSPIIIDGVLAGYNETGDPISGSTRRFNDTNKLLDNTCYLWNSYPNITQIRFWASHRCIIPNDRYTKFFTLYSYYALEIILFYILALTLSHLGKSYYWIVNIALQIALLCWLMGILYDIHATTNNETMDNFVYSQFRYNITGYTYGGKYLNSTLHQERFDDQYSFIQNICDTRKYFPNEPYWLMSFKYCMPNNELGEYKINSIVFKAVSLFLLFVVNCLVACMEYWKIPYAPVA